MRLTCSKAFFALFQMFLVFSALPCLAYGGAGNDLRTLYDTDNIQQVQFIVKGTVVDENGVAMPEVNVIEKGTFNADVTDKNGEYSLKVSKSDAVIVFSFIGYFTKEVTVNNQAVINTKMEPETSLIGEVVVVGYGTQKKATLQGTAKTTNILNDVRKIIRNTHFEFHFYLSGM